MRRTLFFSYLFFCVFFAHAQIHSWSWAKKTGNYTANLCVDRQLNLYTAGSFTDTCVIADDTLVVPPGSHAFYIAKYDASRTAVWAKILGPSTWAVKHINAIKADAVGNIYIAGDYFGDLVLGNDTLKRRGNLEGFIAKLNNVGNVLWAKGISTKYKDMSNSLVLDDSDNIYTVGNFSDTFDLAPSLMPNGSTVFLLKLNTNGAVVWAKQGTDTSTKLPFQEAYGIAIDKWKHIYVTGWYGWDISFNGIAAPYVPGYGNVFLAKFDGNGNPIWVRSAGGLSSSGNIGFDVVTDNEYVYLGGQFSDTAYFGSASVIHNNSLSSASNFLAKYDSSGNIVWVKNTHGNGYGGPVVVDRDGNVYINKDSLGYTVSSFAPDGAHLWSVTPTVTGHLTYADLRGMAIDDYNHLYVCGDFDNSCVFGSETLTSSTSSNSGFVACMTIFPSSVNKLGGNKNEHDILLSPNPASNMVAVDVQGISSYDNIKVFDQLGRVVFNQQVAKTAQVKQINLGYLTNGIYYLQASGGGQVSQTKKIIIQR